MYSTYRIRDPVHDLIEFQAEEFENALWGVIQTRAFQRLRRVKQLGFSDLVYPGATHSRFAHCVGVFHTARQLMGIIKRHLDHARNWQASKSQRALAAALVHDLGHGPFSHAFEDVGRQLGLRMADHTAVSDSLIRNGEVAQALNVMGSGFASDVADIIKSAGPGNIYGAVVSSQFDADRLDYMRRDRLMTGTQLGAIDFQWLIANLEVGQVSAGVDEKELGKLETFVLGPKAIYAAETYVLGLFQLYPTVYFHKTTRGAEKIFSKLLERLIELIRNGDVNDTGLPSSHPIVHFAKAPDSIENALRLDDTVIWGALTSMADGTDLVVQNFSQRLRDRKLYKVIDVRERIEHKLGHQRELEVDQACAKIEADVMEWLADNTTELPRILIDQDERDPYKQIQESKGPLNQIRIKTASGELVDLGERSDVVRAIKTFKLFRLYVADSDDDARRFVDRLIRRL